MPQEDKQYRRKYDKTADTDRDGYLRVQVLCRRVCGNVCLREEGKYLFKRRLTHTDPAGKALCDKPVNSVPEAGTVSRGFSRNAEKIRNSRCDRRRKEYPDNRAYDSRRGNESDRSSADEEKQHDKTDDG